MRLVEDTQTVQDVYGDQIQVGGQWFHAERIFGKPASEFSVGDPISVGTRIEPTKVDYKYVGNCTQHSADAINDMVDQAEDVTYEELSSAVGEDLLRRVFADYFEMSDTQLADDIGTSFHKSTFKGAQCYYIRESGIEWVFCPQ